MSRPAFHLAFPVDDLERAREFYGGLLGCREGRSSPTWVDFDFFGHQITAHLVPPSRSRGDTSASAGDERVSPVDGDGVPVRHFGVILAWDAWQALAESLAARGVRFRIGPRVRFRGQAGEQATMFFEDPSGNALELKAFRDERSVFARDAEPRT
jgi:extradiol dioxygenase family protein